MALTKEEKLRRKEERRQKKYTETHKVIEDSEYKLCSICNEWLPFNVDYFYKNKSNGIDGFNPYCIECTKKKSTNWKKSNPEKWNKLNIKSNSKPETKKRQKKAKEKYRHSEKFKEWVSNNKDKLNGYSRKRNMNKKHEITKKEWNECKEYFNNSCAYCELSQEEHFRMWKGELKLFDLHKEHVDHKGSNKLDNCVPACYSCNSSKHDFDLLEWYNEDNPNYTIERLNKIYRWINEDYKKYINNK
ncbi:HNH endonuclease [Butyricicoccus sp. 1XD8-22]|nr:HNH endonuclease [Butyricicoccus sp. 1XD8-22]